MTIVASALEFDRPQSDGRRWIRVAHTDHLGAVHHLMRKIPALAVIADEITDQASSVERQLSDSETRELHEKGPANNNLLTIPLNHTARAPMLRFVIRRAFLQYMDEATTINRRFRLAQFLEALPAATVAAQLDIPAGKVNSLQASMSRLLALQGSLSEFVGEIVP